MKLIPIILSGGSGARLWALSRKHYPKHYIPLVGDNSMLQETILRLYAIDSLGDLIIVCNNDHQFLVVEQCQQINIKNPTIILEPIGRNTAPAITAAALQIHKEFEDAVLLVISADHIIQDVKAFYQAINIAINQAQDGRIVTFGIVPTDANTSYGDIKFYMNDTDDAYKVENFVEKPNIETALHYLEKGNYLWNSGMFVFKASTIINELTFHSPEIVKQVSNAVNRAEHSHDFIRLDKDAFELSL
jgi:mannose-1-phosphate guanylyltransferase/mannose-6-phosphate isomerase